MLLLLSLAAPAAVLTERLGEFQRTTLQSFTPLEAAVYQEYGLDAAEKAQYTAGERKLEITALRAKDPTGAFGIFHWLRPPDASPFPIGDRGAQSGEMILLQFGNYVLILRGSKPQTDHLELLLSVLPRLERGPAPPLGKFLPPEGRIPNTEKLVLGPVVLQKLGPFIPPSVAAFHLGAEAQAAEYSLSEGRLRLLLFGYPTPQLARAQLEGFQKLPEVMAKRSGPLIAVIHHPRFPDEAEKLLALVRYEATLTWTDRGQSQKNNLGDLVLNIILLAAILVGLMLGAGLALGGTRILISKLLPGSRFSPDMAAEIIQLHLLDK